MSSQPHNPQHPGGELDLVRQVLARDDTQLNGDDAAILPIGSERICISSDTAVAGVHLHESLTAWQRGYRAAACAWSDIAAMAAQPSWATCSVSAMDSAWSDAGDVILGVEARCREVGASLVGGDLVSTPGPASITVTCIGLVQEVGPVRRCGARPGDVLAVTGLLGEAAAALAWRAQSERPRARAREDRHVMPPERHQAALALAPFATAMIDLSDGIATDARHLAEASDCGIRIDLELLPTRDHDDDALRTAASFGDDYELLVALPPDDLDRARAALARMDCNLALTKIGCCADTDIRFALRGTPVTTLRGYEHR